MGNENLDFQLWLRSKFDGDALKAAEAEFNRTKKAADGLGTSADELGYSMKNLKAALVEVFAAAELWAQFKEGFEQVSKLEQVMNELERQTKRNGDSFEVVKGKIVGFADQLKKVAGLDDDAVIAGMTKLYTATQNVDEAMKLARLSADIAIATGKDYGEAQGLVMSAAQGNVRALKELGLSFETTGDKQKDADIALQKLQKTFGGAAEGAKGLKVELNRMNEQWEDVRNTVVENVTPAISVAIKTVQTFFTALDGAWGVLADGLVRTVTIVGKFGSYLKSVATGDMAGMKDAVKAMGTELAGIGTDAVERTKDTVAKIEAIWSGAQGKITGGEGKAKGIGAGGAGGGAKTDQPTEDASAWVLIGGVLYRRQDLLKATEDLYKKAREIADREEKFKDVRARQERQEQKQALAEEERDREAAFRQMTQRIVAEVRLRKQAAEVERQMQLETANAAIGLAGQLFGQSKGLAIAQAVINTYEGATKALAQGGIYGPILAAVVIAAGLVQVAKISSTNPDRTQGSGFDDPRNDRAAYLGGRRWAADMIGEFTKGVSSGWSAGMTGGMTQNTTNDNRRTINVHMHGAGLIDPSNMQAMKNFKRSLDLIDTQVEGQRATARRGR